MRQIKFRVWETLNNKMTGWEDLQKAECSILNRPESVVKNEFVVMQYTGLKDKNGKEIYSNDLVIWDGGQYEVIFSDVEGSWILKDDREDWECPSLYGVRSKEQTKIEVIGNSFEGLLKPSEGDIM